MSATDPRAPFSSMARTEARHFEPGQSFRTAAGRVLTVTKVKPKGDLVFYRVEGDVFPTEHHASAGIFASAVRGADPL